MLVMAAQKELIGHTGDIIADNDVARLGLRNVFVERRHRAGRAEVIHEEFLEAAHGAVAIFGNGGMIVDMSEQEALERAVASRCGIAESSQALWGPANVVHGRSAEGMHALLSGFDQVGSQRIEDVSQDLVEFYSFASAGMRGIHLRIEFAKERHFAAQDGKIEKLGFEGIVEIGGVVSNFIDPVNQLSFERRALIEEIFSELGEFSCGIIARMFDDAFTNFKRKI